MVYIVDSNMMEAVVERKHGMIVRPMASQRNEDEELKQEKDAAVLQPRKKKHGN